MKPILFLTFFLSFVLCIYGCTTEYIYVTSDDDTVTSTDGTDPDNPDNSSGGSSENDGTYDDAFFSEQGDGTWENPYTASQVIEMINSGLYDPADKIYYVKGIVSYINGSAGYSDGTCLLDYYISDDGIYSGLQGKDLLIYDGYNFGGAMFPSLRYLHIEDKVIVSGRLSTWTYGYEGTPIVYNGVLCYLNGEGVDDVCVYMADYGFKEYCLSNFDTDGNGKVSLGEANTVTKIECSTVEDFAGILYFSNLESFTSYSAKYLDLSRNVKLSHIKLGNYAPGNDESSTESAPIETLDLSNNTNLTTIEYAAFSQCYNLTSATLPETVAEIGNMAFCKCSGLKAVVIPDGVTTLGHHAFFECKSLESVILSKSLTSIGNEAFRSCSSLTSVVIPDDITTLEYGAFSYCSLLKSVTLSKNLTSIGERAFQNCSKLTSVVIPDSVTSMDYAAFSGCTSLEFVTLSENLTSIGGHMFGNCSSLTSVVIPDGVTAIGEDAFIECSGLSSVTVKAATPPSLGDNAFSNIDSSAVLYVHSGSEDAYANSDWAQWFSQILPME